MKATDAMKQPRDRCSACKGTGASFHALPCAHCGGTGKGGEYRKARDRLFGFLWARERPRGGGAK